MYDLQMHINEVADKLKRAITKSAEMTSKPISKIIRKTEKLFEKTKKSQQREKQQQNRSGRVG